jgi:hypothetical protein
VFAKAGVHIFSKLSRGRPIILRARRRHRAQISCHGDLLTGICPTSCWGNILRNDWFPHEIFSITFGLVAINSCPVVKKFILHYETGIYVVFATEIVPRSVWMNPVHIFVSYLFKIEFKFFRLPVAEMIISFVMCMCPSICIRGNFREILCLEFEKLLILSGFGSNWTE